MYGPNANPDGRLRLRLAPRLTQAALLRAHVRLWLAEQGVDDDELLDILVAANEAFGHALSKSRQPRSIAVHVDGRIVDGTAELVIRDHAPWEEAQGSDGGAPLGLQLMNALMDSVDLSVSREGTSVRLRRILRSAVGADEPGAARGGRLDLLRRNPIFGTLPVATLEHLDGRLIPFAAAADETIIREGDPGDLLYLVAKGRLDVSIESYHVATLEPGAHVGEIALLRQLPRTATVVAGVPVELYALTREDFLTAIGEHAASRRAAEELVESRLTDLRDVLQRALA